FPDLLEGVRQGVENDREVLLAPLVARRVSCKCLGNAKARPPLGDRLLMLPFPGELSRVAMDLDGVVSQLDGVFFQHDRPPISADREGGGVITPLSLSSG